MLGVRFYYLVLFIFALLKKSKNKNINFILTILLLSFFTVNSNFYSVNGYFYIPILIFSIIEYLKTKDLLELNYLNVMAYTLLLEKNILIVFIASFFVINNSGNKNINWLSSLLLLLFTLSSYLVNYSAFGNKYQIYSFIFLMLFIMNHIGYLVKEDIKPIINTKKITENLLSFAILPYSIISTFLNLDNMSVNLMMNYILAGFSLFIVLRNIFNSLCFEQTYLERKFFESTFLFWLYLTLNYESGWYSLLKMIIGVSFFALLYKTKSQKKMLVSIIIALIYVINPHLDVLNLFKETLSDKIMISLYTFSSFFYLFIQMESLTKKEIKIEEI